jgi:hypothetical protein
MAFADCCPLLEQAFSYLSLDLDFKLIEGLGPRAGSVLMDWDMTVLLMSAYLAVVMRLGERSIGKVVALVFACTRG